MSLIDTQTINDVLQLTVTGDYIKQDIPEDFYIDFSKQNLKKITINLEKLEKWDSSLLAILLKLYEKAQKNNIAFNIEHAPSGIKELLKISTAVTKVTENEKVQKAGFLEKLGSFGLNAYRSFKNGAGFLKDNLKIFFVSFYQKITMRHEDFLFALQECGPEAMPIVLLISFMVGLILAFVGAIQLQTFGAEVYVASLVTIGMTRIMGAIMVGIIMAGRTGSAFAATIGTMQVNEEIDALKTMGISTNEFLVMPRMLAIVLVMPLLTMLADFSGILGGAFVGIFALDIPFGEYLKFTVNAWHLKHFLVGVGHAFVFGFIIAIAGCYFGVNASKSADSVGKATTNAVVYGIVWMIIATGIITFCLQRLGI